MRELEYLERIDLLIHFEIQFNLSKKQIKDRGVVWTNSGKGAEFQERGIG